MANTLGIIAVTSNKDRTPIIDGENVLMNGKHVSDYNDKTSYRELNYTFWGTKKENNRSNLNVSTTAAALKAALWGTVTNEVINLTVIAKGETDKALSITLSVPVESISWGVGVKGEAANSYVYIYNGERSPMRYKVSHTLAEIVALV